MVRTLTQEFAIELKQLFASINLKYNFDFRQYSDNSMKRSVVLAMDRMGCHTLSILEEKVINDSKSFYDLLQSLTISTTEMFRDPLYFLSLREKVIPTLKTYPSINIWVAGCSTGEEVYSLAILLQEEELLERTTIYATDINPKSLEKASAGVFDLKDLQLWNNNYKMSGGKHSFSNYYSEAINSLKFDDTLKTNITFTDHSLATDSAFCETHLISCRNVLIYFDRHLQDKAFGLFRDSLCRKGFLGLGNSETIQFSKYANSFDPFVKKYRIFRKS